MKYNHQKIEKKWQKIWQKQGYKDFRAVDFSKKKKIYLLSMFPYPSGEGLHVGHVEMYTGPDIVSRYLRHQNYNVLQPIGYDAFGLPAEQYAIKNNISPKEAVDQNIKNFERQFKMMGFSYDWERVIKTTDPNYYKWTQWIFLKLYEKGLAYEAEAPVNYCPQCKVVLADEEVEDGKCFRCNTEVERRYIKQWMLKITAYAERLLKDLDLLDWPENIKVMQKNWIGKSEGYEAPFRVLDHSLEIKVFTTRVDTIFGATYLVLAPENPLISEITTFDQKDVVKEYIANALRKSEFERQAINKEKTGVFTGAYAINPATHNKIPIWISDYVLSNYGTGAIMAVPAHDERDFEFAQKFHLPKIVVIKPEYSGDNNSKIYTGEGILENSGPFDGRKSREVKDKIALYVGARKKINYKLRDWVFSRQRFWGEPIPVIKCSQCGIVPLKEKDLPLRLPEIKKYKVAGEAESPLAQIPSWVNVRCPKCHNEAKRETNTMPQWAGSSWYYLRYLDPKNKKQLVGSKKEKYWMPVDIYVGGVEHAVLHLLYARFWHKFLYDLGYVSTPEPFIKLVNQGLILGEDNEKMSKSRGNVISPDKIVSEYSADVLRMYTMFMGAFGDIKPWHSKNLIGIKRFLQRVWDFYDRKYSEKKQKNVKKIKVEKMKKVDLKELESLRHQTIKKVSEEIESFKFNTAISHLMEYLNALCKNEKAIQELPKDHFETLVILLHPFAPFMTSEIWSTYLKHKSSLELAKWPKYDAKLIIKNQVAIIVQINGKVRADLEMPLNSSKEEVEKAALKIDKVKNYLGEKSIRKVIFVPNRLINFVI